MLNIQHRMRPEISAFVRQFYQHLIYDHRTTENRESIIGLKHSIFYINHSIDEEKSRSDLNTSKTNKFEAKYLSKLAQYLVNQKQFYPDEITILSMYLGQTSEIKKSLLNLNLGRVKCTTVDNYQGEENKVILLSLVRSNKEGKVGFLDVKNRVCVALSRARLGFFVIGNLDFICANERNGEWSQIVKNLKEKG